MSGWLHLLSALTDDELDRYGEIARDQRDLEYDRWWAQVLCIVAACGAVALLAREVWIEGDTRTVVALMIAGVALSIWPYRKAKMRRMWNRHCAAVAREQARRKAGAN